MIDKIVVFVTAGDEETAARIARTVVEERLAACVNIVPVIRSIYRWEGELEDDREALLVMKTRADRFDALQARVAAIHPYDVPEIIRLPIEGGHAPYLEWIDNEVGER